MGMTSPHVSQRRRCRAASFHASAIELGQCREGGDTIVLSVVAQREQSLMMHAGRAVMPGLCAHHMGRRFSFAATSL